MPIINRYQDIDQVERETRKDYIDRHSPFIQCASTAKAGEHPDDNDHYIRSIQLYNEQTLVAEASFPPGTLGGNGTKDQAEVTFNLVPTTDSLSLTALSYCTKHGLWECDSIEVAVEA